MPDSGGIDIEVLTQYVEAQSQPEREQFVFAYTITITNNGERASKLLNRHWVITDALGHVEEVRGEGVVGQQPRLRKGESFRYTSGAVLKTPVGAMQGSYEFEDSDGRMFEVPIQPFSLSQPNLVH
jgi:ApaG protein